MGFKLEREMTDLTPYILIDEDNGYMKFDGESYHENIFEFYKEIRDWLTQFLKTDFTALTFDCELKYFNSSTVKVLLGMLLEMDSCDNCESITVNWITTKNNRIIIECGEDFEEDVENLTFNLITN